MKKALTISILALAFIGGFLIFYNPKPVSGPTKDNSQAIDTEQKWESKIDEQASVTVTVTPSDLSLESNEWKFDVVLSTHSVELDQDMTQVAVLVDDGGNEYKPLRWEGAPVGGHHREGALIFDSVIPYPQHLKLIIRNIGFAERLFTWTFVE